MFLSLATLLALQATPPPPPPHQVDSVTPFPALTGKYRVGTAVAYLADTTRSDADFPLGRPVTVQAWYPAGKADGPTAPYLIEPGMAAALLKRQYYGVDSAAITAWSTRQTRSVLNAPAARGRHPLLTFSVGLGVIRANYTSLAEELASHGYIVLLVESPYAGLMLRPGAVEVEDTVGRTNDAAGHRAEVTKWAGDISYVLTTLQQDRAPGGLGRMSAAVDWSRVAAAGHSSGGMVALEVAHRDPRIRAAINLDGGVAAPGGEPLADVIATGTSKPALFLREQPIYSDADFARRGTTREAWERGGAGGHAAVDAFTTRATGPLWFVHVAGTGHLSFSDAPFVMPSTITRFGGKIIAGPRGLAAITSTMRMFLGRYAGPEKGDFATLRRQFPELTLDPGRR